MKTTPYPTSPGGVVPLTVQEFPVDLATAVPSLDAVCRLFGDDANRAVVWLVRFRALKAICERADLADWLRTRPDPRDLCEVAAACALNERWEFDGRAFCSAVDALAARRPHDRLV